MLLPLPRVQKPRRKAENSITECSEANHESGTHTDYLGLRKKLYLKTVKLLRLYMPLHITLKAKNVLFPRLTGTFAFC